MRFFSLAALALVAAPVLASPVQLKTVQAAAGPKKAGSYIVTLSDGVSKSKHIQALLKHLATEDQVTHADWDSGVINGFAAKLGPVALNFLRAHPEVARIEEDAIMSIQATTTQVSRSFLAAPFTANLLVLDQRALGPSAYQPGGQAHQHFHYGAHLPLHV